MIRRTGLARQSDKRRAEQQTYDRARQAAYDRDRGRRQAATTWPDVACWGKTDPHHIAPVGRFPELRCDVDNIITLCRRHHDETHNDPIRARELGIAA